jgi:putative inorganic carbon (hco3(-)) transporter
MMHFGLESYVPYVLYCAGIVACLLSVFWRPITGIFFLIPLIPLQTVRYHLNDFPLGESVMGVVMLAVVVGLLRHDQPVLPKTPWTKLLCIYGIFTFVSLCLGSLYLGRPLPLPGDPRFGQWQEYMMLPALLLLTAAVKPSPREMKAMVVLMCLATLSLDRNFWETVSGRDFSSFSYDLRDEGAMGYAGVNGLAAFEAQIATFLLVLAAFEQKRLWKLGYVALAVFSAICLTYSLSRGGYLALLVGWLFLGLVKQRKLLVLLVLFGFIWTSLVPRAVQQRVSMTYDQNSGELDHSAAMRVALWQEAMPVIRANPVLGVGFYTYWYVNHVSAYRDSHNIYVKVLFETGVVGLILFLWLIGKTFWMGYWLFRRAKDPFLGSLGLGLAAWVLCSFVANFFGDRWTALQVNGYLWVLAGLVARGLTIEQIDQPSAVKGVSDEPVEIPEDLNAESAV